MLFEPGFYFTFEDLCAFIKQENDMFLTVQPVNDTPIMDSLDEDTL